MCDSVVSQITAIVDSNDTAEDKVNGIRGILATNENQPKKSGWWGRGGRLSKKSKKSKKSQKARKHRQSQRNTRRSQRNRK